MRRFIFICIFIATIRSVLCTEHQYSFGPDISYPGARQKVLFLTNSDHEQSKACIAICKLLLQYPIVDVHIGSFPELGDAVSRLPSGWSRVRFHPLQGTPYMKQLELQKGKLSALSHPPGLNGATASRKDLPISQVPWDGNEYLETYRSMLDVIKTVNPAMVVIDPMLRQANDAVLQLGYQYVILSTSNLRDLLVEHQSVDKMIREHPAIGSGFSSPLPWHLAPYNAYMWLQRRITTVFSSRLRRLNLCRRHYGVSNPVDLVDWYRDEVAVIVTSSLEIEHPISIPSNVIACGPISTPAPPPTNLEQPWQDCCYKFSHDSHRRIILIDLQRLTETEAKEIAQSLLSILLEDDHLQVLWNIRNHTEIPQNDEVHSIVDAITHISHNRTRKLQLDPSEIASLLASATISFIVHRGETGLFHDALTSGVSQLLLPKWQTNYDYAIQAEWLGVGKWANKAHAPSIKNGELTAVLRNLVNQQGEGFRITQQATRISAALQAHPGQLTAAKEILKALSLSMNETNRQWEAISDEL